MLFAVSTSKLWRPGSARARLFKSAASSSQATQNPFQITSTCWNCLHIFRKSNGISICLWKIPLELSRKTKNKQNTYQTPWFFWRNGDFWMLKRSNSSWRNQADSSDRASLWTSMTWDGAEKTPLMWENPPRYSFRIAMAITRGLPRDYEPPSSPQKRPLKKAFLFFLVGGGIGGWANGFPWYKEFPNKWIPGCQIKNTKKLLNFFQWVLILNSKSPVCLPQVSLHDFHRVHSIHSAQLLDDAGCLGGDYEMPGVTGASPTCCCSTNLPALLLSDLVLHHPKRRLGKTSLTTWMLLEDSWTWLTSEL